MSTYVSNRNGGGATDEQGHYRFQTKVWLGNILSGLKAVQNSPLARNVLIGAGDLKIDYGEYAYTAWNDANVTVSLNTADTTNPRLDRVVAYIDRSLTSGGTNNPGYLKFMAIAGMPGASPTKASDVTVQSAVTAAAGAVASPWVELAVVRVNANATTIPDSVITDTRVFISPNLAPAAKASLQNDWLDLTYLTTLSYVSWDSTRKMGVLGSTADLTGVLKFGDRIRISQTTGGTKYFIVHNVTSTQIYGYFGTDYTFTNETVTAPVYSRLRNPSGFPLREDKWTQVYRKTTRTTVSGIAVDTWANLFGSLDVGYGSWLLSYQDVALVTSGSAGYMGNLRGLGTAATSGLIADTRVKSAVFSVGTVEADDTMQCTRVPFTTTNTTQTIYGLGAHNLTGGGTMYSEGTTAFNNGDHFIKALSAGY